ncbi:hypothetical protein C9414_19555, partial [Bacillus sp. Nf3]
SREVRKPFFGCLAQADWTPRCDSVKRFRSPRDDLSNAIQSGANEPLTSQALKCAGSSKRNWTRAREPSAVSVSNSLRATLRVDHGDEACPWNPTQL